MYLSGYFLLEEETKTVFLRMTTILHHFLEKRKILVTILIINNDNFNHIELQLHEEYNSNQQDKPLTSHFSAGFTIFPMKRML